MCKKVHNQPCVFCVCVFNPPDQRGSEETTPTLNTQRLRVLEFWLPKVDIESISADTGEWLYLTCPHLCFFLKYTFQNLCILYLCLLCIKVYQVRERTHFVNYEERQAC